MGFFRATLPLFWVYAIRGKCPLGVTDMRTGQGYDAAMKRVLTGAAAVILSALLVPGLFAQNTSHAPSMHGTPPSHGGFRPAAGPSFIPRINPGPSFRSPTPCCGTFSGGFTFGVGTPNNPFFPPTFGHHHHGGFNNFGGGFVAVPYVVPVYPYGYPYGSDMTYDDQQATQQPEHAQQEPAAPTIFERRARRAPAPEPSPDDSYAAAPQESVPTITASDVAAAQSSASEPTSVLIFRDGHQLEVQNYAIVGDTLYDLTPGHPRKIALASIDIPATVQANDDRGVTFRVPVSN
jgi:hypothetical protein